MKPELSLCEHLIEPPGRLEIPSPDILDWYDGPVTAIVRCATCDGLGLLELLDWSRTCRVRVYALAAIERGALEIYLRDVVRGSCDPGRFDRESAAFVSSAGPAERLLALDVDSGEVLGSSHEGRDHGLPDAPWPERLPAPDDPTWFARLGLDKSAV